MMAVQRQHPVVGVRWPERSTGTTADADPGEAWPSGSLSLVLCRAATSYEW